MRKNRCINQLKLRIMSHQDKSHIAMPLMVLKKKTKKHDMLLLRNGTDSEISRDAFKLLLSIFHWDQLQIGRNDMRSLALFVSVLR